jgi:phosphopantetheinyl transferase
VARGLELSIAHAADRVVVAVCRGAAVGVDVEPVRGCGELAGAHAGVLAV